MNHLTVFAEYRAYLIAIAQKILGNTVDVEDLLQETYIRWQQTPLAQIRSPKAFLSTVIKRLCLNHVQSAYVRQRGEIDADYEPVSDEQTQQTLIERITPALSILLERLSPRERLVLLLRDVFDYEYEEIAPLIKKNATNCRQLLRRAYQHLSEDKSRFTVTPEKLQQLVREFVETYKSGDLRNLVAAVS
jgi:RNA polymerase sigma-70 factor (ECF subfamily)